MINNKCYTLEWVESIQSEFGGDTYVIEKAIYALTLLEYLAESDLDFVFKGGTSLLLHLDKINRLSVDIDIVCAEEKDKLEDILYEIRSKLPFIVSDEKDFEDDRGERDLPNRRHFRFYYNSINNDEVANVLLDIVNDKCKLPTVDIEIKCGIIETENNKSVAIPTIEALLGDKLTAFAPTTIGVHFELDNGETQELQVIKQLFDVGELFNYISDIEKVKEAYIINYKTENGYSNNKFSIEDVLNDTKHQCLRILSSNLRGYTPDDTFEKLNKGIRSLRSHLSKNIHFRIDKEAKNTAAKAYLLAEYIAGNCKLENVDLKYSIDNLKQLKTKLPENIKYLEKLKRLNPEAYYYLVLTTFK